ncbi:MAG: glycine cleavage system protein T [candidate division Zixibacteria bacterium CG_4_9_14_3_um_filter_46_8]|nr:MAG: glycine cleavage system protein T [candidate division Zixibacteria bacterium CG_4_9_14_3_um_filter_46_8]
MSDTKLTPFYDIHLKASAKIVDFAGYKMPIQYRSIMAEHLCVRGSVGVFDLSHMGEFTVTGNNALEFLQRMTVNDVASLGIYQVQYTAMCYPDGGIVDDLLIYRLPDKYFLVVNAANIGTDFSWLEEHLIDGVTLNNISDDVGLLAIQGPDAQKVLAKLTVCDLDSIAFYHSAQSIVGGHKILFSRTGYTGEDGFELYVEPSICRPMWDKVFEAGQEFKIEPIGLGARDSLRLEMKYALYGNDIDQTTNPIEAGLGWICKVDKGDFIGRDAIARMKVESPKKRLVCFELNDRGIPRHGYNILHNGIIVGKVTSGAHSPSLEKGIGLGYVPSILSKIGSQIEIDIRGKITGAIVVKPPFYKSGSHR